ncbi:MAG TPA: single-stranded DNA-binding protein [Blastocatellia bacterium]|nr:single-stranded DNA-binding protein [Blastocatellia bacterium]
MPAFAQLIGRLGQDPELRYTNGGNPVVNLSVASNRQKKGAEGERVSVADWFRITVYGRDAEVIAQYAKKGSAIAFNGRLQTESFVDREGQQRTSTCLVADSFEFVPTQKRAEENTEANAEPDAAEREETRPGKKKSRTSKGTAGESDIPF